MQRVSEQYRSTPREGLSQNSPHEALAESDPAFNVAVLHETFQGDFEPNYHEEYLVHGIVKGPHYKAVPFHQLCNASLPEHLPSITKSSNPLNEGGLTRLLSQNLEHFKVDDLIKFMEITHLYGKDFTVPFAVILFCRRKHPKLCSTITASGLHRMVDVLGGRIKVLEAWGSSYRILYDGTYPEGYEAIKQMIRVMRMLHRESIHSEIMFFFYKIEIFSTFRVPKWFSTRAYNQKASSGKSSSGIF